MRKIKYTALIIMLIAVSVSAQSKKLTNYVNPMIGTAGHGHTYPGAVMPFGMVQLSPDTGIEGWDWCSGYHYSDNSIMGFSHTHLSGTGGTDYADILLMPTTREIKIIPGSKEGKGEGYRSSFKHENEKASPGYYSVILDDYNVKAELTVTNRVGLHKYTFPKSDKSNIIIDLKHGLDGGGESYIKIIDNRTIEGYRKSHGWAAEHTVYFIAKFSKPFESFGTAVDDFLKEGRKSATGKNIKGYVRYSTGANEAVLVKVGISHVSIEGARKNLEAEMPGFNFESTREEAEKAWEKELGKIIVETANEDRKTIFYTALYHTMITPNLFNDVDGKYYGMDRKIHEVKGENVYTVFSLWDTFRALHPLHSIIDRSRTLDFVKTMLLHYKDGGLLPVWELAGNETWCMIGYHSIPVIFDSYMKGIDGFDSKLALEAMKTSANKDHHGLKFLKDRGYIPAEKENESISKLLEYSYDDWCIAQFAKKLGAEDDYKNFNLRSMNYRNVFDKSTGFFRGKLTSGAWYEPFNPLEVNQIYTEATAWQYNFFVPHDVKGMIDLHGSNEKFIAKIDEMFAQPEKLEGREQPDISGLIGQYVQGNEPSHHIAYLYNYAGKPSKTQERIRNILSTMYTSKPDGLCGNDDCGQMSAWYVFSSMGFYPVTPGQNTYAIGAPLFDKVTINLENGKKFVITAAGNTDENKYIKSAKLSGSDLKYSYFTHDQIANGGEAEFEMTSVSTDLWGTDNPALFTMLPERDAISIPFINAPSEVFYREMEISLNCPTPGVKIYYTLDGSEPSANSALYTNPVKITGAVTIKAIAIGSNGEISPSASSSFIASKYPAGVYVNQFHSRYNGGGAMALTDGRIGGNRFQNGEWQGFEGADLDVTIDLTGIKKVKKISINALHDNNVWIFLPHGFEFYVSADGKEFKKAGEVKNDVPAESQEIIVKNFAVSLPSEDVRYIRVVGKNIKTCPAWHKGAGGKAWLFVDEIVVE